MTTSSVRPIARAPMTEDDLRLLVMRHERAIRNCIVRAIARHGFRLEHVAVYIHHPSHGYYEADRESIDPRRRLDLGRDGFLCVLSRMETVDQCEALGKPTAASAIEDSTTTGRAVPLVMLCDCASHGALVTRLVVENMREES